MSLPASNASGRRSQTRWRSCSARTGDHMMTADEYVNSVLDQMPRGTPMRAQIATELRAHIAERVAHGHSLDDVLRQLGDPVMLADSYLAAEPLVAAPHGDRAIAKLIDALLVLVIVVPLAWLSSLSAARGTVFQTIVIVIVLCGAFFLGVYTAIAEYRSGQTVGKRIRGLRV